MESLKNLYHVDLQVRGLRSRLDAAQRYLTAQESQLSSLGQQREELESRRRQAQASVANFETESQGHDDRIEKLRDQLNSASTNKQYQALLSELDVIKDEKAKVEDRMMEEMETIEQLGAQLVDLETQIAERRKVRDHAESQLAERKAEVGEQLAELESDRNHAASGIPAEHLERFEVLATNYDGEAMAHIEEIDRRHRDYACGECHMTVPFEHIALLVSGADQLVFCTACDRILYLQEETRGALAKK